MKNKPPQIAVWLLALLSTKENKLSLISDIEEEYKEILGKGIVIAHLWLWLQVLLTIPSFMKHTIYWSCIMLKNYLKIAIRNLTKHKLYSFINVSSLAIGMACSFVILLYLSNEFNFDSFHKNADSIYRVVRKMPDIHGPSTRNPMAPAMKENFPEIDLAVRTWQLAQPFNFRMEEKSFQQEEILFADPDFFNLFTFEFISGDSENPLANPFSVVLTQSVAEKYFGNENPIGKTISFDGTFDLNVTAVIKNVPQNTHLKFEVVIPIEGFNTISGYVYGFDASTYRITDEWLAGMFNTYLRLKKNANPKTLEQKFPAFLLKYAPYNKELLDESLYLQPIKDIHLFSQYRSSKDNISDIKFIYAIIAIGLVILLMSCFNYINLTTARFSTRSREISIRKIVGAKKKQLVSQFLMEVFIFSSVAFILSFPLMVLFKPVINDILGYNVSLNFMNNSSLLALILFIGFLAALISGSYPALYFSTFKPGSNIKDIMNRKTQRKGFRNAFVIFQFSITIVLLIGTSMIYRQVRFMKSKDLGYTKEQIVVVPVKDDEVRKKSGTIYNELLQQTGIVKVSFSSALPSAVQRSTTIDLEIDGKRKVFEMSFATIDFDFFELYNIGLVKGRNFSKDHPADLNNSVILNESAVNILNWPDPIGKELNLLGGIKKVIGVVKDFNFQTLHREISPLALRITGDPYSYASIKISTTNIPESLNNIKKTFEKFAPDRTFERYFFDAYFENLYHTEENLGRTIGYCSFLAIIIAILGLFGLSFFITEQRTNEIGVRKVVGATVPGIVFLLSKEFTKWVLIANLAAWPVAYFLMKSWLQNFAYRMNIEVNVFLISGLLTFGIALLTVSFQSIKAALANPVDSLRCD